MIPKIIHYCWLSNDPVPQRMQQYMRTWKEKLPEYEFIIWNFDKFDINSSMWVKEAYEAKKYAFATDYIRLYAVYHYGGIYMDMDVEVVRSFNDLLDTSLLLGKETDCGIEAGVFGAEKGHPYIKYCLDYYEGRRFIKPDGQADTRILPSIMFEILQLKGLSEKNRVYSPEYFTAKSYSTGEISISKNTHTIHHFVGSWLPFKVRFYNIMVKILGLMVTKRIVKIYKIVINEKEKS